MKNFKTMEDAFDYCRARDCPGRVQVGDEWWKIYPSGYADPLNQAAVDAGLAEGYLKMVAGKVVHA